MNRITNMRVGTQVPEIMYFRIANLKEQGGNRGMVISNEVFKQGADRFNEKLKTPVTNARGEIITDTIRQTIEYPSQQKLYKHTYVRYKDSNGQPFSDSLISVEEMK